MRANLLPSLLSPASHGELMFCLATLFAVATLQAESFFGTAIIPAMPSHLSHPLSPNGWKTFSIEVPPGVRIPNRSAPHVVHMIDLEIFESDGRFCLRAVIEEDLPDELFAECDLQGGGYTWAGVLQSLLSIHAPALVDSVEVGAEADNFFAYAEKRQPLETAASLLRTATKDRAMLSAAIDHAGADIE